MTELLNIVPNLSSMMLRGRLVIGSLKLPLSFRCVRRGMWLLLLMLLLLFKRSWRSSATTKRTRRWVMEAGMLSSGCENCKQRGPSVRWVRVAGR